MCFGWWGDILSVSGFCLDTPSSAKDEKLIAQFDAKLRDGLHCINQSLANYSLAKMLDDDFVSHIRKISGCEQNISSGSFTYAKGALEEVLSFLRVVSGLSKACRVFASELERATPSLATG